MSETTRLGTAIKTISEKYLGNVIKAGDEAGILKWSVRLADYATRLAAISSPALTPAEADAEVSSLSHDQPVAFGQIIAALGLSLTPSEGGGIVAPAPAVLLQAASATQNAQLTLMGVFGTPDDQATFPEADFTLYRQYHEGANGAWAPKAEYANTGAWSAYADSID